MRIIYQSRFLFIGFICAQASYADHHFSANLDNLDAQQQQRQQQAEKEREIQHLADNTILLLNRQRKNGRYHSRNSPAFPLRELK